MIMANRGDGCETIVAKVFDANGLGAPFKVNLHDCVQVTRNTVTGEIASYRIPDLDGLIRTIVVTRVLHPRKLNGAEIKFLRKSIEVRQKDLASKLEMTAEHLSRCEAGSVVMSPSSEKLFRIFSLTAILRVHKMNPCDEKTKFETALFRLFDSMKSRSAHEIDDFLVFDFHRAKTSDVASDGDSAEEGQWNEGQEAA